MNKEINIYMYPENTDVAMTGDLTEFDILFAIATLFDYLTPKSKQLALAKLENLKHLEVGELSEY